MDRRRFLSTTIASILAAPLDAEAQQLLSEAPLRIARIAFLSDPPPQWLKRYKPRLALPFCAT
jgi:hypothetical protein